MAQNKVEIISAVLSPTILNAGDLLNVSITVRNDTNETLATQGPNPGFIYDEGDTFRSRGFTETRDSFRIGIDFEGNTGIDHPYRWGLGAPLAPGQTTTITGAIRLKTAQIINYWAGLVREGVLWLQDRQGTQTITVNSPNSVTINNVAFAPTSIGVGDLLNVSITVHNGTNETLATQGPNPGFIYDEGDTFRSRGFTETYGSFRVGIDFDGNTEIDHPYRWGLGTPLAPGQTATITGAIRLPSSRTINYWAGLVREGIVWAQDRQGMQTIEVHPVGTVSITNVTLTPTIMDANELLNISVTVRNDTNETLATQGPNPGFVYNEGDTFRSRGFTETYGSFRVGIDFDGNTGIDHPYRWGLGAPLAPDQTATITGAIRLRSSRTINYWAGLVREGIVWVQDKQGAQTIAIAPSQTWVSRAGNKYTLVIYGKPTYITGLNYNVNYTQLAPYLKYSLHRRDFKIMRDAGVNAIVGWGIYDEATLEIAEEFGIGVIMPFDLDPRGPYENQDYRNQLKSDFREYIQRFRNFPAVWGWNPGGDELLYRMESDEHRTTDKLQIAADFEMELVMLAQSLDPNHFNIIKEPRDWYIKYLTNSIRKLNLQNLGSNLLYGVNVYGHTDDIELALTSAKRILNDELGMAMLVTEFGPFNSPYAERANNYGIIWDLIARVSDLGGMAYVFGPDQPNNAVANPYDPLTLLPSEYSMLDMHGNPIDNSLAELSERWQMQA